jgi:hypothetical protein
MSVGQKIIEMQQEDQQTIFDNELIGDLTIARRSLEFDDSQFWRRTYCRCLMTMFEGCIQSLRQYTLDCYDGMLGDKEKKTLQGRQGALEGAFNGMDLFMDVAGATTLLKVDSQEWLVLKKAIAIRNRITHPYSFDDLNISNMDLQHLKVTDDVVVRLLADTLREAGRALMKSAKGLQEHLKKRQEAQQGVAADGMNPTTSAPTALP